MRKKYGMLCRNAPISLLTIFTRNKAWKMNMMPSGWPNGKGAEFGQNVNPIVDKIPVDGESIAAVESLISIALYKQRNVTCSHPCFGNNDGSASNNFYLNSVFGL
jgi:hypothetical protein